MNKEKVLPINPNPSVTSYIHYAYPCAIIESRELANLRVNGLNNYNWGKKSTNCSFDFIDENISIYDEAPNGKAEAVIWRKLEDLDEVSIQIRYLKPRDFLRYIDLFLFDKDLETEINREDKTCGVRWNPYGYFIGKTMYSYDTEYYNCVKLRKYKTVISVYASKDGVTWRLINHLKLPKKNGMTSFNVGLHLFFGEDYFEEWKFSNFIQLTYNKENPYKGVNLDYYFFPRKNIDNSFGGFINYLDTHYDLLYDALDAFKRIDKYICWNIDHFYYVNICLDEYYVPERGNFNKHHYSHYNLFYGYNQERRVFYTMGYGIKSTPVVSEIPYDVVCMNNIKSANIVRYRYRVNENTKYEFRTDCIKESLKELLCNENSSFRTSNLLIHEKLEYGIDIIKNIAEKELSKVKMDKRIAFCLVEHSKIMRDRINYLHDNCYISNEDYVVMRSRVNNVVHIASIILGLVIKNQIVPIDDNKLKNNIDILYHEDKTLIKELIKCLN